LRASWSFVRGSSHAHHAGRTRGAVKTDDVHNLSLKETKAVSDTLLTYSLSTEPDPLQVSPPTGDVSCDPAGDPSCATLTILVSNNSDDIINCQSIDFGFSVGKNASDFSEDLTGVAINWPPGWNLAPDGNDFTATPKTATDGAIGKDGLTFTLSKMKVNKEPGTASLLITETASSLTADPPQPQDDRTTSLPLAKFPLAFAVSELKASPESPVDFGSSVTLSWVGTEGATYELRYEAADGSPVSITHTQDNPPQPLPANGNYQIGDLEIDTTFFLYVTLVVKGEDNPPKLERNCPVIVTRPKPQITFFQGMLRWEDDVQKLYLHWEATNANFCNLTGDSNNLGAKDDNYPPRISPPDGSTYTLTAGRFDSDAFDTSEITFHVPSVIAKANDSTIELTGSVAVSLDGAHLYASYYGGGDEGIRILDASTFQSLTSNVMQQFVGCIAVWPGQDSRLIVANVDPPTRLLYVLDAQTLQPVGEPVNPGLDSVSLAFSPDAARLYLIASNSNDISNNTLSVFDAGKLEPLGASLQLDYVPCGIAVSPDGQRIYVTSLRFHNATVNVHDGQSLGLVQQQGQVGTEPSSLCISPDGAQLYVLNSTELDPDPQILVLDAQTLQLASLIHLGQMGMGDLGAWPYNVAISPDGTRLYVVGSGSGWIGVFSPPLVTGGKPRAS
jgi:DNA-binding beta-propeller fold protein YncE